MAHFPASLSFPRGQPTQSPLLPNLHPISFFSSIQIDCWLIHTTLCLASFVQNSQVPSQFQNLLTVQYGRQLVTSHWSPQKFSSQSLAGHNAVWDFFVTQNYLNQHQFHRKKKSSQWNDPTGQGMSWHKDEKALVAAVQENSQTQRWSL